MYYTINGGTPTTTSSSLVTLANLPSQGKALRRSGGSQSKVATSVVRSQRLLSQSTRTAASYSNRS
jgi:hypothetical protein